MAFRNSSPLFRCFTFTEAEQANFPPVRKVLRIICQTAALLPHSSARFSPYHPSRRLLWLLLVMKRSNKVRAVVLCVVYAMLLPEMCNVNYVICDCSVCCSLAVQLQLHSWSALRELGKSGWMCNWKVVCQFGFCLAEFKWHQFYWVL